MPNFLILKRQKCLNYYRGPLEHRHNFKLSFMINFKPELLFVCARCTGIYFGFIVFSFIFLFTPILLNFLQSLSIFTILLLEFILTLPLVIDWLSQSKGIRHSNNYLRFSSGVILALSSVIFFVAFNYLMITGPIALIWFFIISQTGVRLKKNRPKNWGCDACKGIIPEAKEVSIL